MHKFLNKVQTTKAQSRKNNPNIHTSIREIEFKILNLLTKKTLGFISKFYQILREEIKNFKEQMLPENWRKPVLP